MTSIREEEEEVSTRSRSVVPIADDCILASAAAGWHDICSLLTPQSRSVVPSRRLCPGLGCCRLTWHLRSVDTMKLLVQWTRTVIGARDFVVSVAATSNSLPAALRLSSCSVRTFAWKLKTFYAIWVPFILRFTNALIIIIIIIILLKYWTKYADQIALDTPMLFAGKKWTLHIEMSDPVFKNSFCRPVTSLSVGFVDQSAEGVQCGVVPHWRGV